MLGNSIVSPMMKMRCFRNLLGVSYMDRISNEQMRTMIRQEIGHYDDLLVTVKKRKLEWYDHVTRSKGLAKIILQDTTRRGRKRERQ